MSYILDALKRAAEQRHGPAPDRRLLAPSAVAALAPAYHKAIIAGALVVIVVAGGVWLWPSSKPAGKPVGAVVATPPAKPAASVATAASVAPPAKPAAVASAAPPAKPAAAVTPPVSGAPAPTAAPAPRAVASKPPPESKPRPAQASPRPAPAASASTSEPRSSLGRPEAPIVAALPPALIHASPGLASAAAPQTDLSKLRIEVIVYSEQRPQRWAFISGRKYVEGDTILDSTVKVLEIQSAAVVLDEDGRRTTLRTAR